MDKKLTFGPLEWFCFGWFLEDTLLKDTIKSLSSIVLNMQQLTSEGQDAAPKWKHWLNAVWLKTRNKELVGINYSKINFLKKASLQLLAQFNKVN